MYIMTSIPAVRLINRSAVMTLLPMKEAVGVVENAFREYASGKATMPPKIYLDLPQYNGDFRAMPAFLPTSDIAGIKWVNSHSDNPAKGIPAVMALLIANDPETAVTRAVIEATTLTSIRTGASGGVATRHLANPAVDKAAFVGAGMQAYYQLLALLEVRALKEVSVYDLSGETVAAFTRRIQPHFKGKVTAARSVEECVTGADVIVTTTPSRKPLVRREWVKDGCHINAIGADAAGKQELDPAILKDAVLIVDDIEQASHSGEVNNPLTSGELTLQDIDGTLGEIIIGKKKGRTQKSQITVFDSTGLAVQDLASAAHILKKIAADSTIPTFDFMS